jgi:predicted amidophosphoribosyltransferase
MNDLSDSGRWDPDEADIEASEAESLKFRDFVQVCPACKKQITAEMDSCPYCGDILYRNLKDSTFAPRKGPLTKVFAVLIVLIVIASVLGLLFSLIRG